MLRSALATSSRIGLDFALPAAPRSAVLPLARAFSTSSPALAADRDGPRFRWSPIDPAIYRRSSGQVDRAPTHQLSVFSSRNNVMLTFSDSQGPLFPTISGGTDLTFKKGQRGGYEAAHQAALKMFKKVAEFEDEVRTLRPTDRIWLKVSFNGGGQGRGAVSDAISGPDGAEIRPLVSRIEDRTPFRIGGRGLVGRGLVVGLRIARKWSAFTFTLACIPLGYRGMNSIIRVRPQTN